MTRTEHQNAVASRLLQSTCGTVIAPTGYGKSRVASKTINTFIKVNKSANILIVVPTAILKEQWLNLIHTYLPKYTNITVEIINSVIKNTSVRHFNLLVVDEYHRIGAFTFSKIFQTVTYDNLYCFTATIERKDAAHKFLLMKAPVIADININYCIKNKWISDYRIVNIGLSLPTNDEKKYLDYSKKLDSIGKQICKLSNSLFPFVVANKYAKLRNLKTQEDKELQKLSFMYFKTLALKNNIDEAFKLVIARYIVNILSKISSFNIVTFSKTIENAKYLNELFKNNNTVTNVLAGNSNINIPDIITNLEYANYAKKSYVLNTVNKANEGLDISDLNIGLVLFGNSSETVHKQRRGRIIRFKDELMHLPVMFNLYYKDTIQENHLRQRLKNEDSEKISEYYWSQEEGFGNYDQNGNFQNKNFGQEFEKITKTKLID